MLQNYFLAQPHSFDLAARLYYTRRHVQLLMTMTVARLWSQTCSAQSLAELFEQPASAQPISPWAARLHLSSAVWLKHIMPEPHCYNTLTCPAIDAPQCAQGFRPL